jgi:pectate lyase
MKKETPVLLDPVRELIRVAWFGFVATLFALMLLPARGALLFTEEYPTAYGDGTGLGNNQTIGGYSTKWPNGNSSGSGNPICTSAGALSYGPLAPISGSASYGFRCATAGSRDQATGFASQSGNGNSVYLSFLIQVTAATPTERILIGFRNSTGGGTLTAAVGVNSSRQLVLFKSNTAAPTPTAALTENQTYLVVLRYQFLSTADECALWLNPATGGADEASASVPPIVTTSGSDQSGLLSVRIESDDDASGPIYLDEIRVGTTWADVTPQGGPIIGAKLGFTTPPANAQVDTIMNSVVVQVQSAGGAAAASNGVPVTLALTSGSGTLNGTLTQDTDANGKATFADLSINAIGTGKQLTATASGIGAGLTAAVSGNFSITAEPVVSGLVITQAVMTGAGFKVAGNTDQPGVFTQILGSSDVGREATNWLIVAYQNAGTGGEVTFTNPVSPALPNVFYRLRTGNTVTKLEPPSIGAPPVSQIVSPGATATLSVTAVGPQLQYLWFFNGNPIPGATSSVLIIPNAQAGNVGNYHVVVANPAGTVTSATATLGVGNIAPTITTDPQNQTVSAGGTAIFSVAATGTSPLSYQWYANTNSLIADATNAVLTLHNVSTNDSGTKYRVIVSNNFGSDPSADATLTVTPVPTDLPGTNVLGWAAYANVTGGAGGAEVTVNTYAALRAACRQAGPIIIKVDGILVPNESYCYIEGYDKTIIGIGTNSGLAGYGFRVSGTNIIIANMTFSSTNSNADGITVDDSSHGIGRNVWVDHCTFYDCRDGAVDVTKGANYVTVSWCKFYYAPVPKGVVQHQFVNLIASSDSDNPNNTLYRVTFHHNWYSDYSRERMPSVRFGRVHVFNNYYDCFDNNYCVRTRLYSEVLVENNYFLGVQNPWERFVTGAGGDPGKLRAIGNITNNCTFVNGWVSGAIVIPGNDMLGAELNPPPYPYTLTPTTDVPYYVQTYAGHGKYPYEP